MLELQRLPRLRLLDLRFNRKCETQSLADELAAALPALAAAGGLKTVVSFPPPPVREDNRPARHQSPPGGGRRIAYR